MNEFRDEWRKEISRHNKKMRRQARRKKKPLPIRRIVSHEKPAEPICTRCHGTGKAADIEGKDCQICQGTGIWIDWSKRQGGTS